jgi:hypothetical protein
MAVPCRAVPHADLPPGVAATIRVELNGNTVLGAKQ